MLEGIDKIKVLLVDDDVNYLKITEMYLKENGLNISSCVNPIEALTICKEQNIDIVLVDYFMPEITGEEFVSKLREFNNKALVILQTGSSEEKPPIETLTALDIQGYHDKAKGIDELLLLTLTAVKTMKLIKVNRIQEIKLESLNYKKQLLGELTGGAISEAKDQLISIKAANKSIKMNTQNYQDENKIIEDAGDKIASIFSALEFEGSTIMRISEVVDILNTLLISKTKERQVKFSISEEDDTVTIRKNPDVLIFLIIETVLLLINQNNKEISVNISGNEKIEVSFNCEVAYDKEFAKKIVLLLTDVIGVKFTLKNKKVNIYLEN